MDDTRNTLISRMDLPMVPANNECGDDIAPEYRPSCRFQIGDRIISAFKPNIEIIIENEPFWDREFEGWMISPGWIGIHESNFILATEKDQWIPHEDGLWSYWIRK